MPTPVLPDVADLDTFGGTFTDADGVVDPETELAAAYFNRLNAQAVMSAHTAARAWVRVTAGASPTVADHDAVWGGTTGVKPTVSRTSAGIYVVTWAASYNDLQAVPESHTVSIRAANVSPSHSGAFRHAQWALTSATVVTVNVYDAAGAAADCDAFYLEIR